MNETWKNLKECIRKARYIQQTILNINAKQYNVSVCCGDSACNPSTERFMQKDQEFKACLGYMNTTIK